MKKLFNILLVLIMLLTIVPVNAASGSSQAGDKGSITISNAVVNETYNVYKMFDVDSFNEEENIASYTVSGVWLTFINHYIGNETEPKYFTLKDSDREGVKYVQLAKTLSSEEISDFAKAALAYATSSSTPTITPTRSTKATSATLKFEELDLGYYLVDSSLGALCSLNTTTPDAEIKEKNEPTDVDKKITGELVLDEEGKKSSAMVGTNVPYEVTLTQIAQVSNLIFKDEFGTGLTSNKDFKIYVDGTEEELDSSLYEITANTDTSLIISFKNTYTENITDKDATLVIKYTAKVNASALTADAAKNTAYVNYGNKQESKKKVVETYTYGFNIQKTDGTKKLAGAYFVLKDSTGAMIKLAYDETNGIYRPVVNNENGNANTFEGMDSKYNGYAIKVDETGLATIKGLSNGTYFLEEIKAPEGYNKLAQDIEVTIEKTGTTDTLETLTAELDTKEVVNTTGTILPSTGGMGTVLFITIGSLMVLGFGVVLLTKFRMSKVNA